MQYKGKQGAGTLIVIPAFILLFIAAHQLGTPPNWTYILYPSISLVTFVIYGIDKSAAKKGAWRTPESTLHMLAVLGGWPGALVAQQLLRHKTAKAEFKVVYWLTVVLNIAGFVYLSSPFAQDWMRF